MAAELAQVLRSLPCSLHCGIVARHGNLLLRWLELSTYVQRIEPRPRTLVRPAQEAVSPWRLNPRS
jgi:hypothetical protein